MVNKQQMINQNKRRVGELQKGIHYCENQIKKKPAKWEVNEYRTVISGYKKDIRDIKSHNKRLRKL